MPLKFNLGFNCSTDGRLTLKVISSRQKKIESFVNGFFHFIFKNLFKLDELSIVTQKLFQDKSSDPYFTKMARAFGLSVQTQNEFDIVKAIPASGPLLVVMNHPANGRETMALAGAISLVRPDLKVALTSMLKGYPGMDENAIFIDLANSQESKKFNISQRQSMDHWIKQGGVLLAHPAGEVSSYRYSFTGDEPIDCRWRIGVGKIIQENPETQVLPIYIEAKASRRYQQINSIRTSGIRDAISPIFHLRELASGQNHRFPVVMGSVIRAQELLDRFQGNLNKIMRHLRSSTYALSGRKTLSESSHEN
jgi:hypothetical protein